MATDAATTESGVIVPSPNPHYVTQYDYEFILRLTANSSTFTFNQTAFAAAALMDVSINLASLFNQSASVVYKYLRLSWNIPLVSSNSITSSSTLWRL